MGIPATFPEPQLSQESRNPAMILFGSRFISDQTVLDLLAEFLAVAFASKEIQNYAIDEPLPALEILQRWPRLKGAKQKGLQKGRQEIARNLLIMGLPIENIKKATGLSEEDIKKLQ